MNRFKDHPASIQRPREVAHFSYDDNHEYRDDDSSISYYHPPDLGADLKAGFDDFHRYDDTSDPHLDSLLKALMRTEKKDGSKVDVDFVTWRGMMTKILTAPFDMFAEFSMFATLRDGTIYIEEDFPSRAAQRAAEASRPPPRGRAQNPNQPDHKMMTYWGYKFEVLSLLPTPPPDTPEAVIRARPAATVSNHAQHCSIVRTAFGPHSLLLGGEVDGLDGPKPTPGSNDPIPWIELKTAEELPSRPAYRDVLKFERKLLKFWAQSFLLGVPKVIIGFRSKDGILRLVQELKTAQLPGMVKEASNCWDADVCIKFATAFLAHLKEIVKGEGVYKIELKKGNGVITVQEVVGQDSEGIVSKEFMEWRRELSARDTPAEQGA